MNSDIATVRMEITDMQQKKLWLPRMSQNTEF